MKILLKNVVVRVLEWEARAVLRKYKPKIIAVTGSVGKTSTKDAIYTALASSMFVRKSEKSFNSEIGVPLTILGCKNGWLNPFIWLENIIKGIRIILFPYPYPKILVLEVGADRPGDIASITRWLKPDIAIVTRIGEVPVHVEFFKNRAELIDEKAHLVRALKPGGTLILNGDDPDVLKFKELVHAKTIVISVGGEGDLVASHDSIVYTPQSEGHIPMGMSCKLTYDGHVVPLTKSGVLGMHQIYPMLSAVAVAVSLGVNIVNATRAFEHEVPTPGRMRIFRGVKNSVIVDDSYNASPVAVEAALRTLKEIKTKGRKIAMLGDMLELGKHSHEEHVRMGKLAAKCADILVTVGVRARSYAEGALQAGMGDLAIMQYEYSREAGKCVEALLQAGDVVLIKGSQGVRMEHAVKEIMAEPEKAGVFLVRQDEEWQKR